MRLLLELDGDVDVDEFIEDWNDDGLCLDLGTARRPPPTERFEVPLLAGAVLVLLEGVALGVAGNAVYDLVMDKLRRRHATTFTFEELSLPDGTRYIRIKEHSDT